MEKMFTLPWWKDEARSFFTTMAAFLVADSFTALMGVYNGDFSRMALWQLALACLRSSVKALFTLALPNFFPHRASGVPESDPPVES